MIMLGNICVHDANAIVNAIVNAMHTYIAESYCRNDVVSTRGIKRNDYNNCNG